MKIKCVSEIMSCSNIIVVTSLSQSIFSQIFDYQVIELTSSTLSFSSISENKNFLLIESECSLIYLSNTFVIQFVVVCDNNIYMLFRMARPHCTQHVPMVMMKQSKYCQTMELKLMFQTRSVTYHVYMLYYVNIDMYMY